MLRRPATMDRLRRAEPMDAAEIRALIRDMETDRVERKASYSETDSVKQAVCAYANDLPGHRLPGIVVIGVDDKSGEPVGLTVDDKLLVALGSIRDNGQIYPFPSMTVDRLTIGGHDVAVIVVQPSNSPPVKFRGRTCIRVGPRHGIATPEEESRLTEKRRHSALPFDARGLGGAGLTDLDMESVRTEIIPQLVAPDVLRQNGRTLEQQLSALRLIDPDGIPTPAGILIAGVDPTSLLPGAWTQFLRLEGADLGSAILSSHRISLTAPESIRHLEEIVRGHIETTVSFVGEEREQRRPDVPFASLQQILRNAVIHRNYENTATPVRVSWFEDRVEVLSPGGPYGTVTVENFGSPGLADYRNPTLAGLLGQLGYVQRFGVGLEVARRHLQANGNPPLEIQVEPTFVNVTVRLLK
jgi:ATP-dependent DNA helicase RecG